MTTRQALLFAGVGTLLVFSFLQASPRPFRVYPSVEPHDTTELPPDWQEHTEWVFGRLMFPSHPNARFTRRAWGTGQMMDWREGRTSWTQDYPRADRHFVEALRRLTRIHARSVEQPVNPDDEEDIFEWPFLFAGEMGDWYLSDVEAARLREYLLRGGFLFLDDFWGTEEWNRFMESMKRVFPDRPVVELADDDPIFHTVYDIHEKWQVPGVWALRRGSTYRNDGAVPHWRGICDDKGRVMVAMAFNHDLGDSWEWADDPRYPEKYSALGIRVGVNYVIYALTH